MSQIIARIILMPFGLLFGLIAGVRIWLYESGFLKRSQFDVPTISVGNLSVGGTGKTPHVAYLTKLLSPYLKMGILSRGYRRETTGFIIAEEGMGSQTIGDEPAFYQHNFKNVLVAVGEKRAFAIPMMLRNEPDLQTILLDDAFQHMPVKPGLQLLLTEYGRPFWKDWPLPAGRLREWRWGYKRADILIITKCPEKIGQKEYAETLNAIKPLPNQKVFFSRYGYGQPYAFGNLDHKITINKDADILLVCGIAGPEYLLDYLKPKVARLDVLAFKDHHPFENIDLGRIAGEFQAKPIRPNRYILTTEKDAMRLKIHEAFIHEQKLPIFVLPVEVMFMYNQGPVFDQMIKNWLLEFKV
jgi:tetraacyldisaccharide 4'-kinase